MNVHLNKVHFPVTVLGPGSRVGIWFQGCSLRCPGCISRDTWEVDATFSVETGQVINWCKERIENGADGITITGGEPFQQPEGLRALLCELTRLQDDFHFDVLCYSGFSYGYLKKRHPDLVGLCDALITGPYLSQQAPASASIFGSSNQKLHIIKDRYRSLYEHWKRMASRGNTKQKTIQVVVDQNGVWYIGIPNPNDMKRLEAKVKAKGVALEGSSWRA